MDEYTPLDPNEGPTIWATDAGKSTIKVLVGLDPEDPQDTFRLSHDEIGRLAELVDE